jgi:hypothetical protein
MKDNNEEFHVDTLLREDILSFIKTFKTDNKFISDLITCLYAKEASGFFYLLLKEIYTDATPFGYLDYNYKKFPGKDQEESQLLSYFDFVTKRDQNEFVYDRIITKISSNDFNDFYDISGLVTSGHLIDKINKNDFTNDIISFYKPLDEMIVINDLNKLDLMFKIDLKNIIMKI